MVPISSLSLTLALVEDDDDVRTAVGRLLRSMGHRVLAYASAEAFDANPDALDCLILDIRLPGVTGVEFRDRLRETRLPVVLITGESSLPEAERAATACAPLLAKPFRDDDLIAAIDRAMAQARGDRPTEDQRRD
jgi:FixJ family two-component response regulator